MQLLKIGTLTLSILCSPLLFAQGENPVNVSPKPSPYEGEVFSIAEEMPYPLVCKDAEDVNRCRDQEIIEFIYPNIEYPKKAQEIGAEGMAIVSFVIDENGNMGDIELLRDPSPEGGLGEEALRVIEQMGEEMEWVAGRQRGHNIAVRFNIPVKFRLDDDESNYYPPKPPPPPVPAPSYVVSPEKPAIYPNATTEEEGMALWDKFVAEHMDYPKSALKYKIDGKVTVKFIVTEEGKVDSPIINYADDGALREEALRLVNQLGDEGTWTPAFDNGKNVRTAVILDIYFDRKAWKKQQRSKK